MTQLPTDQQIADRIDRDDVPARLEDDLEIISRYTRADALADGVLVDVTEWASADKGFIGGFRIPVAVTAAVWQDIESIPDELSWQDVRGRAHDLLFMASLAARREHNRDSERRHQRFYTVFLPTKRSWHREPDHPKNERRYKMEIGPGDAGEPVVTIMQTDED